METFLRDDLNKSCQHADRGGRGRGGASPCSLDATGGNGSAASRGVNGKGIWRGGLNREGVLSLTDAVWECGGNKS